jgi:hypothetical protein
MNYLLKKLAQRSEQSKNKLVAYTALNYNLTGNWNKTSIPYHVWQEENKNLKLK